MIESQNGNHPDGFDADWERIIQRVILERIEEVARNADGDTVACRSLPLTILSLIEVMDTTIDRRRNHIVNAARQMLANRGELK